MNNEATLKAKIATLKGEVRKLRRIAKHSREDVLLNRVKADALQLLVWRFSGLAVTRRACEEMGMTQRRWQWARALLEMARIHDGNDVTASDFDGAVAAVESGVNYCANAGLESLRIRLPQFVILANARAKPADKAADCGRAQGGVQKLATSRDGAYGRGAPSGGVRRDRRTEIEARHGQMEAGR